jgi:hypothetical protein
MVIHYYFKLKHNIQNDSELQLAKIEVESIIGKEAQEICNFVDILIKEPLNYFVSSDKIRPQDYITRLPYPGRIQGYYANSYGIDLSYFIKRSELFNNPARILLTANDRTLNFS